jgi:SAM-dependent methyltransferase
MRRSDERELLDAEDLAEEAVAQTYRQLRMVHRWLGNTNAVLRLLRNPPPTIGRVLDIGCGQGALLLEIRQHLGVEVIGFDLRPAPSNLPVEIIAGDAVNDRLPEADVAVCVVTAHHLSEAELAGLIVNVSRSCHRFIVLDLVRHPVPLALFRIFVAPLLSRINALDGQTSIRRAFTFAEMRGIVNGALLSGSRPVKSVRHTLSPLWIRQVVDISWQPTVKST